MTPTRRAQFQLVAAAALFSTGGAAIKATAMTGWQVACLRSGIAACALLLFLPEARRGLGRRAAVVSIAYAATLILYVTANKLTTSANTIFLQSTGPLYILLLGPWLLKERVRGVDVAIMAVVALGLGLLLLGTEAPVRTAPAPYQGNILAAISGLTWAFTLMGLRWMGADPSGGSPAGAVVLGNSLAFLVTLPMALPLGGIGPGDWLAVSYLGVFQIALAYALVTRAVGHVPALQASILLLVEPALNPIWSWLAHGERPGPWSLAGGLMILGATTVGTFLAARARAAASR